MLPDRHEHLAAAHELLVSRVTADRHAHSEDPDDPATVQAMQIALHIPKQERPSRTALLEAAARAVVAVCLDDRVITDPQWNIGVTRWYDRLIRKIARRGRNQPWRDVQLVPGVTVDNNGATARAFVPSSVALIPPQVKKLQIQGTDLPLEHPQEIAPGMPLIAINPALGMTVGKAAAQVGHASMLLAAAQPAGWVNMWAGTGFTLQVREDAESFASYRQREEAVIIRDAGFTEVAPDSVTAVAVPAP